MLLIRPVRVESERVRPSALDKKTTSRTRRWSPTPSRRRQRIWRHTSGTGARSAHAEEPRPFRLRVGPQTTSFDQFLARTGTPGANAQMSDHTMLGGARTGGEFRAARFCSTPTNATKCGRAFPRRTYMVTGRDHLAEPRGDGWQLMFDDANF